MKSSILAVLLTAIAVNGRYVLQCWEGNNYSGSSVRLIANSNDLADYNFDNRAASCCFRGVWVLFDVVNYNKGEWQSPMHLGWGDNYCVTLPRSIRWRASSARLVGDGGNYLRDSLSVYQGEFFMGHEAVYTRSSSYPLFKFAKSAVITGCSSWTLYERGNFGGRAVCAHPSDSISCKPGFFPMKRDFGPIRRIGSVRKGCYAKTALTASDTFNAVKSPRFISYTGNFTFSP